MRFRSGIVRGRGRVVYRSAIVALLVAHVALVTLQIVTTFPVVDELAHVPSGVAHWQEHDFAYYRVNPPLGRLVATAPMMLPWYDSVYKSVDYQDDTGARRPEFSAGHRVFSKLGMGIADEFTLPRFGGLAFSLFGAILLGSWVREEAGELAGIGCRRLCRAEYAEQVDLGPGVGRVPRLFPDRKVARRPKTPGESSGARRVRGRRGRGDPESDDEHRHLGNSVSPVDGVGAAGGRMPVSRHRTGERGLLFYRLDGTVGFIRVPKSDAFRNGGLGGSAGQSLCRDVFGEFPVVTAQGLPARDRLFEVGSGGAKIIVPCR